ncbi:hypothetical protein [Candidatus Amarobacter glycogenicus]|uniref:hypothetical protein n=1 Tax=Candidatus Amarobacter glycogenicus TaxID=3140699 RepID=UPI003135A40C|nr:hypothetical protein [Dehalococcoidia bacterium]
MDLQQREVRALRRGLEAAHSSSGAVSHQPLVNGAVLGTVSLPTYDNNLFADGITTTIRDAQ